MSASSHTTLRSPSSTSLRPRAMSQTMPLRHPRPVDVQTNVAPQTLDFAVPPSAISASSISSSPKNLSPNMSPDTSGVTTNSSVQPSPEPSRVPGPDDQIPYAQLPDPILARMPSLSLSGQTAAPGPSTTQDFPSSSKSGLVRRFSNRATTLVSRHRQSSVAPRKREGSVGPAMVRKRSGSTAAAASPDLPGGSAIATDSDECPDDRDESQIDGLSLTKEPSLSGSASSINGISSLAIDGPVWPSQLLSGTPLRKVSKKNRSKRIMLVLDPASGNILWDGLRKKKHISIDDIKEIRTDSDIRQYCRDFDITESEGARWFSIIYAAPELKKTKKLHLIADDIGTFKNWTGTLNRIWQDRLDNLTSLMAFDDKAVHKYWKTGVALQCDDWESPRGEDGSLDFQGFERVCRQLHINASPAQLLARFHAADRTNTGRMDYPKFKEFVDSMKTREDVVEIYSKLAAAPEKGIMLPEFLYFVQAVQGEDVHGDAAKWEGVFAEFADQGAETGMGSDPAMSASALTSFLTSKKYNAPIIETPEHFTLDRPVNEYYVSSSHNTYLLGRQVVSQSSVEGYITALENGCRCVEVDCWDGSDGQPVVLHGRAMTTSISFQEVMTTVKRRAFEKTRFPLWISLEVHTNPSQQAKMAAIIKETFGPLLVTEPLDPTSDKLPSPSQLMGRILIKVKKSRPQDDQLRGIEFNGRRRGNSLTSPYSKPMAPDSFDMPSHSLPQSPLLNPLYTSRRPKSKVDPIAEGVLFDRASISSGSGSGSDEESLTEMPPSAKLLENPETKVETTTERVLGDLGVYCAGVKFRGFDTPEAKTFNHIFSFMESSFSRYSKSREAKKALDRHNMRYLMRVYPDRTRISSNNFDPLVYWARGVQMAALNWQTFDLGMQFNHAMFEGGTDSSGYVLKPSELREIQLMPDGWSGKRERKTVSFSIDVISAQKLMRPSNMPSNKAVHPYVEVEVFHPNDKRYKNAGEPLLVPDSDTPLLHRTQVVPENGFNPLFNKKLKFKITTKYPDLIFVRWSVKMSSDGETYNDRPAVATFTAKLKSLKQGFRTVPLVNRIGEGYVFSTLFCHIQTDPITSILLDCPQDLQAVPEPSSKLRGLGLNVFGRSNGSPKSTVEKASLESSLN